MNIVERAEQMHALLEKLHASYHQGEDSRVSDHAFDRMLEQFTDMVCRHALDKSSYPILKQIGTRVSSDTMRNHSSAMYSLAKIHEVPDAMRWMRNVIGRVMREQQAEQGIEFNLEYKLDGMAMELVYLRGILCEAISRGDGQAGTDVLVNAIACPSIPNQIDALSDIQRLVVHGEVYVTHEDFKAYGEKFSTVDYSNPRVMAGSFLAKYDPKSNGLINYAFNPHEVVEITDIETLDTDFELYSSAQDRLSWITSLGFSRVPPLLPRNAKLTEITLWYGKALDNRDHLPFPIDGVVLSIDNLEHRNYLGYTASSPKWATALKFPAAERTSTAKSVTWNLTMTGELVPVLNINPVEISGNKYDKVPLFNYAYFMSIGEIERGGTVKVALRGDVILQYVEHRAQITPSEVSAPDYSRGILRPPTSCPSCDQSLLCTKPAVKMPSILMCTNQSCRGVLVEQCRYYLTAIKVKQFGQSVLNMLVDKELIKQPLDLHTLCKSSAMMGGTQISWPKKDVMLSNLAASRQRDFIEHVKGLSFGLLTKTCFKAIHEHCESLDAFIALLDSKSVHLSDRTHYAFGGQQERLKALSALLVNR